jgi:hypothetical protein
MASSVSLGWTMMLMLERPKAAFATEACRVVAPDVAGPVLEVGPPGTPTAGAPDAAVLFRGAC